MKKVELLAPAGSMEGFLGALNAGADAFYLAGEKFGARAYAKNFTQDEIVEAITIAHVYGKRVYLTLNTIIKEAEREELYPFLKPFYEAGLDGVILQDLGVATILQKYFPKMELHASTQMTLTGPNGAKSLEKRGFSRIVSARELSLDEIKEIRKFSNVELECFVHGAMCYCYSGQCLFSSVLGGRSGNRGRCAQPCRLNYHIVDETGNASKECFPLSMKDQETILLLDQLIEAGIDSFKIEGRMKKPEYAAGVTAIYRRAIDAYYETGKATVSKEDLIGLSKLYRRSEKQDGYYHKRNGKDMITLSSPSYNGADEAYLSQIREKYIKQPQKLRINGFADFSIGNPATITLWYDTICCTVTGDICEQATKQSVTKETIEDQINKLGNTVFAFDNLQVQAEEGLFYSLKGMKDLRRKAIEQLTLEIIKNNNLPGRRKALDLELPEEKMKDSQEKDYGYTIMFSKQKQFLSFLRNKRISLPIRRIYVDASFVMKLTQEEIDSLRKCYPDASVLVALPYILRDNQRASFEKLVEATRDLFDGYLVRNQEEYGYLEEQHILPEKITLDTNLYLSNLEHLEWWDSRIHGFCLPLEMTMKEQIHIAKTSNTAFELEKIIYGKIPMMISANCIAKTNGTCFGKGEHRYLLTDRYQISFDVDILCENCYNIIYNSVPYVSMEAGERFGKYANLRIQFTTEEEAEMNQVLAYFSSTYPAKPLFSYTTGFDKKIVE